MPKLSQPQSNALTFFEANEADPIRNFGKKAPAMKTTSWLIARHYVEKRPVGQFEFNRFVLTDLGRLALRSDRPVTPRKPGRVRVR
jgi:hypothetical protein